MGEVTREEVARAIARNIDDERFADAPSFQRAADAVLALFAPALSAARQEGDRAGMERAAGIAADEGRRCVREGFSEAAGSLLEVAAAIRSAAREG